MGLMALCGRLDVIRAALTSYTEKADTVTGITMTASATARRS